MGVAGSGSARIAEYDLASSTASLTASPNGTWIFGQWEALSPAGLVFTSTAAYQNGAALAVAQESRVRALFKENVAPTSVPTPVPTSIPTSVSTSVPTPVPTRVPSSLPKTGDDFPAEAMALLLGALVVAMAVTGWKARRGKRARQE